MNRLSLRPFLFRLRASRTPLPFSSRWLFAGSRSVHVEIRPDFSTTETSLLNAGVVFDYGKDENGQDLFFLEEPCDLTKENGFGFIQLAFGEHIGPRGRYKILRKLGWGLYASGWLAKDTAEDSFVAIKALTGYATSLAKQRLLYDINVLQRISSQGRDMVETHCLPLQNHFNHPGKRVEDTEHLCLVTEPLGPSIDSLAADQEPSVFCVKKVLRDVLKGLDYLHGLGIVHTGIHPGSIMVDLGNDSTTFDIESYLEKNPAQKHPIRENYSQTYPLKKTRGNTTCTGLAVSQPFPTSEFRNWRSRSFIIGDFGAAQFIDNRVTDDITEAEMRAPEAILGLPWDEKVDIWSFGCLAFQLLSRRRLFDAIKDGWGTGPLLLHQMLGFTEERFPADVIRASKRGAEFLNPETSSLKDGVMPLKKSLSDIVKGVRLRKKDPAIDGFDVLLKKCIRLNPKERLSAKELLEDSWLNAAT